MEDFEKTIQFEQNKINFLSYLYHRSDIDSRDDMKDINMEVSLLPEELQELLKQRLLLVKWPLGAADYTNDLEDKTVIVVYGIGAEDTLEYPAQSFIELYAIAKEPLELLNRSLTNNIDEN